MASTASSAPRTTPPRNSTPAEPSSAAAATRELRVFAPLPTRPATLTANDWLQPLTPPVETRSPISHSWRCRSTSLHYSSAHIHCSRTQPCRLRLQPIRKAPSSCNVWSTHLHSQVPSTIGERLMPPTGKGCRHSASPDRHIGRFRGTDDWLPPDLSHTAGHGVLRQALPPPFGRWADAPPLRCGLSPNRPVEPVHGAGLPVLPFVASAAGGLFTGGEGDPVFSGVRLRD